jgi:hypothetical protein
MGDSISNKIKLLKQDIDNSLYHVFGCHDSCDAYFCKKIFCGIVERGR